MVLVRDLATKQFSNGEERQSPSVGGEDDETDCAASTTGENPQNNTSPSLSRRPFTRSQTGYVPKRRRRDDSPPVVVHKRAASPPRKKHKSSIKPSEHLHADISQQQNRPSQPSKRSVSEVSTVRSDITIPPPSSTQLCPKTGSSSSTMSSTADIPDRRGPRSRVILPVPVPNLTKKSRGRRVPTKAGTGSSTVSNTDTKDARLYVCKVESCRKCFHRGEHLKRHIRSIHTHEKPFACLHTDCDKRFNRHDNLLQHLKVHKGLPPPLPAPVPAPASAEDVRSPLQTCRSLTPSPPPEEPYSSPSREAYESSINHARRAAAFRRQPSYDYDPAPYGSISEPTRLITNMAVSSLRTEIPPSPAKTCKLGL